jgi:SPP1 gp7 family putative phage head morphogenesis protein
MATTAVRGQRLANTLARMADRLEGKFRNAFLRSMISMADDPELKKLLKDIQAGKFTYGDSIDARLNAVKFDIAEMNEIARQAIAGSAKVTKDVMNLKGSFDVVNDSVIDAARNLSIELSTNLRKSTKESLRQVVEDLISGNISEAEALRRIQLEVGLLPQHAKAVSNYRRTLINAGTPRGKANQLAEQYAKRLLKYRANMISRTEVARATGIGQTQFWRQMRDQDALPPQANRVWITAIDERACPFCSSMNGQVASIDGGWETEKGYMEYPQGSHPHCRCSSGITMRKMTKTGKEGAISKVEEIEWTHWVSKHLGGGHDQSTHAGGNGKINWDSLYGDGIGGFMPDVREELEGYLSPQATSSLEDWVMDSKWPKKYFDEIRDEESPDHYDVLQSRLVEAGFPDTVIITRRGTPNSSGDVRNGSAIEGWSGGSESGPHYGMDTKVYESKVPRKNIIGVGSLEEGEFFYINDSSVVTELRKHLGNSHDQSTHGRKGSSVSTPSESEPSSSAPLVGSVRDIAFTTSMENLDADEFSTLEDYVDAGYERINDFLRGKPIDEKEVPMTERDVKNMDSVFQKMSAELSREDFVFRGMSLEERKGKMGDSWVAKLKVGDVLEDKGFVSTSQERTTAETFAKNGTFTSVIFRITLPKGTRAMAGNTNEEEIILQRGSKMKVVKVTQIDVPSESGDKPNLGGYEVEVEIVP